MEIVVDLFFILIFFPEFGHLTNCGLISHSQQIFDQQLNTANVSYFILYLFQIDFNLFVDERQIQYFTLWFLGDGLHQIFGGLLEKHIIVSLPSNIDLYIVDY